MSQTDIVREHVLTLLTGREAHADFAETVAGFPAQLRGTKAGGSPHTGWQLLEHLRIGQWDILEFIRDPRHVSPKWPEGYWPESDQPPSAAAWDQSVARFIADAEAIKKLIADPAADLTAPLPHGTGQTLLREALVVADHNAYHLGQLFFLKKMLGSKSA